MPGSVLGSPPSRRLRHPALPGVKCGPPECAAHAPAQELTLSDPILFLRLVSESVMKNLIEVAGTQIPHFTLSDPQEDTVLGKVHTSRMPPCTRHEGLAAVPSALGLGPWTSSAHTRAAPQAANTTAE